jgi:hypothetical protein
MEAANAFLPEFMADSNRRFAVAPSVAADAHRPLEHGPRELDLRLSEHHARVISKNLAVPYRNVVYPIRHSGPGHRLRQAKVTVCELPDGAVVLLRDGRELPYTIYRKGERPPPPADDKTVNERVDAALAKQPCQDQAARRSSLAPQSRPRDRPSPRRASGLTPRPVAPHPGAAPFRTQSPLPTGDICTLRNWGHFYFGLTAATCRNGSSKFGGPSPSSTIRAHFSRNPLFGFRRRGKGRHYTAVSVWGRGERQ